MKKLTGMCKTVWKKLSTEEKKSYYYDRGMYGFISDVAGLLHVDVSKITDETFTKISEELVLIECTQKVTFYTHGIVS